MSKAPLESLTMRQVKAAQRRAIKEAREKRAELCLEACAGIPDEVLETCVLHFNVDYYGPEDRLPSHDSVPLHQDERYLRGVIHAAGIFALAFAVFVGYMVAFA